MLDLRMNCADDDAASFNSSITLIIEYLSNWVIDYNRFFRCSPSSTCACCVIIVAAAATADQTHATTEMNEDINSVNTIQMCMGRIQGRSQKFFSWGV